MEKSWFVLTGQYKALDSNKWGSEANIRYPFEFAEKMILEFTKEGDYILDPFAGFGTTLIAAAKMNRIGIGVEYEKDQADYIAEKIQPPNRIVRGSATKLSTYELPKFDFSLTSPPYMRSFDPSTLSSEGEPGGYEDYLDSVRSIYEQVRDLMKPDVTVAVEMQNTFDNEHPMTPFAWDVAKEISKVMWFERELVYCFEEGSLETENVNHSYVMLFKNKPPR